METLKRALFFLVIAASATGCSTITNLTASKAERNPDGLYRVEAAFKTRQQSLRADSIKPQVMIGTDSYPMQPTRIVKDRWETLVPVPPDKNALFYRFKFDYDYDAVPARRRNSKLSPEYKLEIVPPK